MFEHNADFSELAAVMVLLPELEPVPEPFRLNPDLLVLVDFGEYIRLIRSLPGDEPYLYTQLSRLRGYVQSNNELKLLKSFYVDMALAVGKELHFAESCSKQPTVIRHTFHGCNATKYVPLQEQTEQTLRYLLSERGFPVPEHLSASSLPSWTYACKLVQDAMGGTTKWVEK